MVRIVLRRILNLIIIMFAVGTLLFFLIRAIPGDPALAILGPTATPEELAALRNDLGLGGPLWSQYVGWFGRVLRGDFGTSTSYHLPVIEVVFSRLPPTLFLALFATALSFGIAILVTVLNTAYPRNIVARALNQASQIGLALPEFWLALVLVFILAIQLRILPTSGYVPLTDNVADWAVHLVLPVACLVAGQAASFVIVLREGMLGQMSLQYLRTARVKGLSEFAVGFRHALPNALLPVLTMIGLNFASLIGGVVILEQIFVIPGLGSTMVGAINSRDFPLLQGGALFTAFLFVTVNLITDLTYALVNPKVRVS